MSAFNIRPHHGLCVGFYTGSGYSKDFTNNMEHIIKCLSKNPMITLVTHSDIICEYCPHKDFNSCDTPSKVMSYDLSVLKMCNLKENDSILWNDFRNLVKTNILENGSFDSVCSDCQWSYICHQTA